MNCLFI